ncbi:DUF1617 family protein [Cytobacillus firmus]|uniref:Uncharacterized protein n=1 Tax=Cytobacillus firmus TaxID=1399 RepID=A0A800N9F3_CYTFI|nr:DUF1617 family protein [Cytobacillus firmus]KAF0822504.1 hypothetical protein KIS1582_3721 [Cytobacillus firmus]
MQVQIKNSYIPDIMEFLYNLSLKGKQSRHRTRFIKMLQEKWKQVGEEERELIKEFAGVDEKGEPNRNDQGNYAVEDVEGFKHQQEELLNENFVIDGGDHHGMLKTVKEVVLNFEEEVSGNTAVIYDYLCEAFENEEKGAEE